MPSRKRALAAKSDDVTDLEEYRRAKYLAASVPADAFLADAEQTGRILTALVRLPEVRTGDLWSTLVRMRMALDMYVGGDPLADKLRQKALALESAIWARG